MIKLLTKKNYFMFLAMLVFVFVSTSALAISGQSVFPSQRKAEKVVSRQFPPLPVLQDRNSFPILSAQGVLAVDLNSGVSLYDKNSDAQLLPASTTKIVTALTALDYFRPDDILTVPKMGVDGHKMGLVTGSEMRFSDLLDATLVYSANDAAETIAANYPGGKAVFVEAMNNKARELFMGNSYFQNPIGLDGSYQTTTARDLVRASEVAMRNPVFAQIVGKSEISMKDVTGKYSYNLRNINQLLGNVPGVLGVKTGWTENARENLVTYVERDNHKIMIAVLGSQDRFGETKELIDWMFTNYKWEEVTVRNNQELPLVHKP